MTPPAHLQPADAFVSAPRARVPGLTWRSGLTAVVLSWVCVRWECHVSLVNHSCQVSEGTPSVPAVAGLVLLSAVPLVLRRLRPLAFTPAELIVLYLILYLSVPLSGPNSMRQLMPAMTALRYFAAPENHYAEYAKLIPRWVAPRGDEVTRTFYEGADGTGVPWRPWLTPLLFWALLSLALNASHFGLVALFRRAWTEGERLRFPLAELAVDLTTVADTGEGQGGLLRSKPFWVGVGVAAAFNLANILHAFSPTVPCLGLQFDFGQFFTEHPWAGLRPLVLTFRPEVIGLGYLVNMDVLLSVWVFYLLFRVENFATVLTGYSIPGMPFEWPQGGGAYLAIAVALCWSARGFAQQGMARAWRGAGREEGEAVSPRAAVALLLVGGVSTFLACKLAGMTLLATVWLLGFLAVAALVYSRIRAQTGLPLSYIVPRREIPVGLVDLVGASPLLSGAGRRGLSVFSLMTVITRLIFPQMVATQLEGVRMGELTSMRRSHLLASLVIGVALGIALGYWSHLTAYYHYGCNILDGGTTEGGWRTRQALLQYERLEKVVKTDAGTNWRPTLFRLVGFGTGILLVLLRTRFLQFPLNPVGFAIAATFGHHTWFPLFVAWLSKWTVLRLGGPRVYRALAPAFVGLAVGHFLIAGAVWGVVGAFSETAARRYLVWFA